MGRHRKYLHIESSPPSVKGNVAQLNPPCCHLLVWQKSGNQGHEWQLVQSHVTEQEVHQVILEATVGGEAGDIAIDDVSFISGPCPATDLCDFEEGNCNWQQDTTDDAEWVRHSGSTLNPNTGPDGDHTTNTSYGHYYYLLSTAADLHGQRAQMMSPFTYQEFVCSCGTHMYGEGTGTLNVYQQDDQGKQSLLFSQAGDQGLLWRFTQVPVVPWDPAYRIVVEGIKAGPSQEGDMAFNDVRVINTRCSPPGYCDFESSMCNWCNVGGGVDHGDWLRGRGASLNPNTGSDVDHTTNSTNGFYLYVDSSVGQVGDMTFLISDVLQPISSVHCLKFWYRMYGSQRAILRVYINNRRMHDAGNDKGILHWIKAGNNDIVWREASVTVHHEEAFWVIMIL
ncbi:MAM and LDL-receptor class A domain-containing protein 1-like [Thalassophryne amazonica]|uniref:MAM and LDL-receptor class A domain-containing protein 1-like n=1 Tax=Thalassophryne amazonica TaxID=390379 RepID=UPI0014715007|nr:MAM and LDL-receptor class A domain-containing protein 1-like [Thalassophryne amazonica]